MSELLPLHKPPQQSVAEDACAFLVPVCSVIVPCYNSSAFLERSLDALESFLDSNSDYELILIDDASHDATAQILDRRCKASRHRDRVRWHRHAQNAGKGGAIMRAMQMVRGEVVCFTDADLSYHLDNLPIFRKALELGSMVIANRVDPQSLYLIKPTFFRFIATRHLSSRLFNTLVSVVLRLGVEDVHAGLKMAYTEDFAHCVARSRLFRFSFDSELLFLARKQGLRLVQHPVEFIYQHEPSTVSFFRDGIKMVVDLFRIRILDWLGRYS